MKSLVFLAFIALSLVACSGGSSRKKSNESCKASWAPGTLDNVKAKEKVDASDSAKSLKMEEGNYITKTVRLFYFDKSENVRLDITVKTDSINEKTGDVNFALNCARGIKPSLDAVTVQFPYADEVSADASGNTKLVMSELTVVLDPKAQKVIQISKADNSNKKSDSLKDVYPKDKDTKHVLYKLSETSFESRVQLLGQGRKDSKSEERSLDVRAYINYVKEVPVKTETPSDQIIVLE